MEFLDLDFNPDTLVVNFPFKDLSWTFGFTTGNTLKVLLRHICAFRVLRDLEAVGSRKWQGASNANLAITTKGLRELRKGEIFTGILRLLDDGVNSPYCQFIKGFRPTPQCSECGADNCNPAHILWDCPFWQDERRSWNFPWQEWPTWKLCSQNPLICTDDLVESLGSHWNTIQVAAVQILLKWEDRTRDLRMVDVRGQEEITGRLSDQLRPTEITNERQIQWYNPEEVAVIVAWKQQHIVINDDFRFSRVAMDKWGGHPDDLAAIKSVLEWCKLRPPSESDGRSPTWFELLIFLLLMTGKHAPFLKRIRSLKDAQWRLQKLVLGLLRFQELPDEAAKQTHGCIRLFPSWPGLPQMPPAWQLPIHDGLKVALDHIVDLNTAYFLNGAETRKLHVTMDDILDGVINWKAHHAYGGLFSRRRARVKTRGPLIPESGLPLPLSFGHWDGTVSEERLRIASELLRIFTVEAVPLDFMIAISADALKRILGPNPKMKVKHAITRREAFLKGWSSRRANLDAKVHCFKTAWSTDEPECALCGFRVNWKAFFKGVQLQNCEVIISGELSPPGINAHISAVGSHVRSLQLLIGRL